MKRIRIDFLELVLPLAAVEVDLADDEPAARAIDRLEVEYIAGEIFRNWLRHGWSLVGFGANGFHSTPEP